MVKKPGKVFTFQVFKKQDERITYLIKLLKTLVIAKKFRVKNSII